MKNATTVVIYKYGLFSIRLNENNENKNGSLYFPMCNFLKTKM